MSLNGGSSAQTTRTVSVSGGALAWVTTPGNISLTDTLNGKDQTATQTQALDVGDGSLTAGWNISLTSTTFSSGLSTLSTSATTVASAPTDTCDSSCTSLATNSITYPYTVPAGSTAPAATKLYNAAANTGVGNQTVTPTFRVAIPSNSYAGTYTSTWTYTLASGP